MRHPGCPAREGERNRTNGGRATVDAARVRPGSGRSTEDRLGGRARELQQWPRASRHEERQGCPTSSHRSEVRHAIPTGLPRSNAHYRERRASAITLAPGAKGTVEREIRAPEEANSATIS